MKRNDKKNNELEDKDLELAAEQLAEIFIAQIESKFNRDKKNGQD